MKNALKGGLLTLAVLVTSSAHAALPPAVATTFTAIGDDIQSVFDLAFPAVMLGLGLVVVIKLVKRFGSKI